MGNLVMAKKKKKEKDPPGGFKARHTGHIENEIGYAKKRKKEVEARDHIIGEGYAERQIAESLRLAGKINTEI